MLTYIPIVNFILLVAMIVIIDRVFFRQSIIAKVDTVQMGRIEALLVESQKILLAMDKSNTNLLVALNDEQMRVKKELRTHDADS